MTLSASPLSWWKLDGSVNFFRAITDGGNLGENYESDTYSWFTQMSSKMTVWKSVDIQVRFNYRAPHERAQGKRKAMYHADFGISKDIFKNKGTLTFSAKDVFNTRKRRYEIDDADFFSKGEFQWRSRQLSLTLNYRLNQKKQRTRRGGSFEGGGGMDF